MNNRLYLFLNQTFANPGKVLDLGNCFCFDMVALSNLGWECFGADVDAENGLDKPYHSKSAPFDLIFSCFVLHKVKDRAQLFKNSYNNLKPKGWFFVHAFDESDPHIESDLNPEKVKKMLKKAGYENVRAEIIHYFDEEVGHNHNHIVIEAVAQK